MKKYTTTTTSIKDLKKGQKVEFYGQIFIIKADAVRYERNGKVGYWVDCEIETKMPYKEYNADILNHYDGFQGTAECTYPVIN